MMLAAFPDAAPLQGLIGGVLIGLAAALMLLGAGRIAGVSGILARGTGIGGGSMSMSSAWSFLIGLPLGALIIANTTDWQPANFVGWPALIIAGLFVGFGTRMGSGCTSGHGVCGISRLSQRSIVATLTFIASGVVTVFVLSKVGG